MLGYPTGLGMEAEFAEPSATEAPIKYLSPSFLRS